MLLWPPPPYSMLEFFMQEKSLFFSPGKSNIEKGEGGGGGNL